MAVRPRSVLDKPREPLRRRLEAAKIFVAAVLCLGESCCSCKCVGCCVARFAAINWAVCGRAALAFPDVVWTGLDAGRGGRTWLDGVRSARGLAGRRPDWTPPGWTDVKEMELRAMLNDALDPQENQKCFALSQNQRSNMRNRDNGSRPPIENAENKTNPHRHRRYKRKPLTPLQL